MASFEKLQHFGLTANVNNAVAVADCPDGYCLRSDCHQACRFAMLGFSAFCDFSCISKEPTRACADVEDLGATLAANFAANARGNGHGEVTRV